MASGERFSGFSAPGQSTGLQQKPQETCHSAIGPLAYLAPSVLEALVIARRPLAIAIIDLMAVAELPWDEQMAQAAGDTVV